MINGVLVAVSLAVSIFTVLNVRSQLITPLNNIHDYAEKIRKGDFDAKLEGSFNFEFKELHDSLTEIVANFKMQVDEAQSSHEKIKQSELQSQKALDAARENEEKVQKMLAAMSDVALHADIFLNSIFAQVILVHLQDNLKI